MAETDNDSSCDRYSSGRLLSGKELQEIILPARDGKPIRLTITDWRWWHPEDKRTGETTNKIVLSFAKTDREWAFSASGEVKDAMKTLLGTSDMNQWVGYQIELTVEKTKFGPGIRPGSFLERVAPPKVAAAQSDEERPI